jgi:tetratricopeptide (TPR) repeat protein
MKKVLSLLQGPFTPDLACPLQANFNLGNVFRQEGNFEAAEFCYKRLLKATPNHWRALLNMAVALTGLQRTSEAQKYLRKAFKASGRVLLEAL